MRATTLVEAWSAAKGVFTDDVRQEAALKTLERKNRDIDEVAFFYSKCRWLTREGRDDGGQVVHRRRQPRQRVLSVSEATPESCSTDTEAIAIARDEIRRVSGVRRRCVIRMCEESHG